MTTENREPWLSLSEICEYLSVSDDTLYRFIKHKGFPAQKVGNRWKAQKSKIDAWIRQKNEMPLFITDAQDMVLQPEQNIVPPPNQFRVLSLFSGCGGLDLGFLGGFTSMGKQYARNNTRIVFANDIDEDAEKCYNSNTLLTQNGDRCTLGDIRAIPYNDLPIFDIMLAGFPCQPFSNAGNRKGVNDDNGRGTLFEVCEQVLKSKIENLPEEQHPIAFVFENVRGIMSSKMPDGTTVPEEIKKRMDAMGYNVSMQLICASNYGVPQSRYRFLIIGIKKSVTLASGKTVTTTPFDFKEMEEIVKNNDIPSEANGTYSKLLIGSILQDLPQGEPECEYWEYSKTTQDMVEKIGPCAHGMDALQLFSGNFDLAKLPQIVFEGRSWKNIDPTLLTPRFRKIYDDPKRYHAPKFFRRFAFGEINGTITASAQPENCGITHPVENRRYSVREIARIQSFPDSFSFGAIPLQSRYKVIGNAVPPVLGWVIANALIAHLEKEVR